MHTLEVTHGWLWAEGTAPSLVRGEALAPFSTEPQLAAVVISALLAFTVRWLPLDTVRSSDSIWLLKLGLGHVQACVLPGLHSGR